MTTEPDRLQQIQQRMQHLSEKISQKSKLIAKENEARNHVVDKFLKRSMLTHGSNEEFFLEAKTSFEKSSGRISLYKKKIQSYASKLLLLQKQLESLEKSHAENVEESKDQTEALFAEQQDHDEKSIKSEYPCVNCATSVKELSSTACTADSTQREVDFTGASECVAKYTDEELNKAIHDLRLESQELWIQLRELWSGFSDETDRLWGSLKEVTKQRQSLEAKVSELTQRHIVIVDEMRRVLDDIEVERDDENRAELKDALERCLVRLEQLEDTADKPEEVTRMAVILALLEPFIFLTKTTLLVIIHVISIISTFFSKSND